MKSPADDPRASSRRWPSSTPTPTPSCTTATPFELLVATILSAQSTDARVNMVTPALFARYPDARALAAATPAELEPQILSTGFFRQKSKALVDMAQILVRDHGGQVPADMDALTTLPGVGRKTANVVLGHALGVPGLPVDRHVLRVANRIGIAEGDDPVAVEAQLCARLPAVDVDARVRRADPARPPHLPAASRSATSARWPTTASTSQRCSARPAARRPRRRAQAASHAHSERPPGRRVRDDARRVRTPRRRGRSRSSRGASATRCGTSPSSSRTSRAPRLLATMEIEPPDSLYGLYEGTPLPERQWADGNRLPDRITIFQRPIEEDCEDEDEVRAVIGETLIHEVGHYFGLSEEEIEEIEERYWRGETLGPDEDDEP